MSKYQKMLDKTSNQAYINHCLTVKLEYKDKWLINGTPMNHPIHVAYETDFTKTSYRKIRIYLRENYRTLDELKNLKRKLVEDNTIKYSAVFNVIKRRNQEYQSE